MKNILGYAFVIFSLNLIAMNFEETEDYKLRDNVMKSVSSYYAEILDKHNTNNAIKEIDLSKESVDKIVQYLNVFDKHYLLESKDFPGRNNYFKSVRILNSEKKISIVLEYYARISDINANSMESYLYYSFFPDIRFFSIPIDSIEQGKQIIKPTINRIGNIYYDGKNHNKFIRDNIIVRITYYGHPIKEKDNLSEELFQLAKKIDHKICELNGIPYDPNFPEKEDNDSEEDKEVKRKIADGTYTKIEDLPKPQSQSDNVKNNVKNPQEEKTVTKIDSPISPKIENSKSKIFIILGILFTVVFGGFLLIYKKCKKKKIIKDKNTELNN